MIKTFYKKIVLFFGLLLLIFTSSPKLNIVTAVSTDQYLGKVQLGGDTIGIQIKTNVEIVGKYDIVKDGIKVKPWENSNIYEGDFIYSLDNNIIKSNNDVNNILQKTNKSTLNITLIRDDELIETTIEVVKNNKNVNTIGLYIKDHISGIGTLTFVNLQTNKYGALGHSVSDALGTGSLYDSTVKGIKKGIKGIPGEKYATLSNNSIGTIESNSNIGIFGDFNKSLTNEIVNVVKAENVKTGPAQIITVVSGNSIKKYDIEIINVEKQNSCNVKGIKFKVTDNELINETGGIIQGMSGSPIIQNGNLVGAVSHVVVNDPSYGFGVFAEWMYYQTQ